jgi:uncharacterized protein YegP (UPF0339 family)
MAARKYVGLVYEDEDKQWRWKLMAPNGNNVANAGEGYKNKAQAKKMLMKVTGLVSTDTPFEMLVEVKV